MTEAQQLMGGVTPGLSADTDRGGGSGKPGSDDGAAKVKLQRRSCAVLPRCRQLRLCLQDDLVAGTGFIEMGQAAALGSTGASSHKKT
mgnify:CR=1 FL=1